MPALDPTLLALLSIFGGAALTVAAGFVGAWIQGRREHTKWLRDQRYLAHLDYLKKKDRYRCRPAPVAAIEPKRARCAYRQLKVRSGLASSTRREGTRK